MVKQTNPDNYYQRGPKKGLLKEKFLVGEYIDWRGTKWENSEGIYYELVWDFKKNKGKWVKDTKSENTRKTLPKLTSKNKRKRGSRK